MTSRLTLEDLMIAARTVWGEARGEPETGQKMVAHVILNRWRAITGQFTADRTVAATCLRTRQFSCWNPKDPNFAPMLAAGPEDHTFRHALAAVLEALDEIDPSRATHYHTRDVLPDWVGGRVPVVTVGNHLFYNDVP